MSDYVRRNVGTPDRLIRIVLAVVIITGYNLNYITGTLGLVLSIIATLLLATGFIGLCPLYYPFGINARKYARHQ